MGRYFVEMFGISLGLTLLVELTVGQFMQMRSGKKRLLMVLVNVFTNPMAVLLIWLGFWQIPVELAVMVTEVLIYRWFSRDEKWDIPHPVGLSVAANGISWFISILLQYRGVLL